MDISSSAVSPPLMTGGFTVVSPPLYPTYRVLLGPGHNTCHLFFFPDGRQHHVYWKDQLRRLWSEDTREELWGCHQRNLLRRPADAFPPGRRRLNHVCERLRAALNSLFVL